MCLQAGWQAQGMPASFFSVAFQNMAQLHHSIPHSDSQTKKEKKDWKQNTIYYNT